MVVAGHNNFKMEREERAGDRIISVYIIMEKEDKEMEQEKFEL